MGVTYFLCVLRKNIYDGAETPEEKADVLIRRTNQMHKIYKKYGIN